MKIYKVNKDKTLNKVFEGKIYKKSELLLKEDNGQISATMSGVSGIQNAFNNARNIMSKYGNVKNVQVDAGNIDGVQDKSKGEGVGISIPVDANGSQKSALDKIVKDPNMNDAKISFTRSNSTNNMQTESRRLSEMRKNGLIFTKEEMDRFLKTI